jgi:serine/threonine-protein kinase
MICPACQAPNDDSSDTCIHCGRGLYALTLGARLGGRYEITGVLGRGGMGVVYLARDLELDETVALKVLRTEIAGSEEAARRFRSEIKLARRIRHRNVCGIHEYGQGPPASS